MAGLCGFTGTSRSRQNFEKALNCLVFRLNETSRCVVHSSIFGLGYVPRYDSEVSVFNDPVTDLTVLCRGLIASRQSAQWHALDATAISKFYSKNGLSFLEDVDGFYSIVVIDTQKNQITLIQDSSGSYPLLYRYSEEGFFFSANVTALLRLSSNQAAISKDGMVGFLLNGYPLGKFTMFDSVFRMTPGQILIVDMDSGVIRQDIFLSAISYGNSKTFSEKQSTDELYDRLIDSHRVSLCDSPETIALALTGGYDSRCVLGVSGDVNRKPDFAFTWGAIDTVPGSDPVIARYLADIAGVEHRFFSYQADDFITQAGDWLICSELLSDNMGHFAAGRNFLDFEPETRVFIGDHVLGNSGFPGSIDESIRGVTGIDWNTLPQSLTSWVTKNDAEELMHNYSLQINTILKGCDSDHPKNIQHYLEFHLGTFGWLLAPGYYKEPLYDARRPMLTKIMLNFACELPPELRIGKGPLLTLLKQKYPHLYRLPKSSSFSLIDWKYELANSRPLQSYLWQYLKSEHIADLPFCSIQTDAALAEIYNDSAGVDVVPITRQRPARDGMLRIRDLVQRNILGRKALDLVFGNRAIKKEPGRFKMLQRMILLSMFNKSLKDGKFQ